MSLGIPVLRDAVAKSNNDVEVNKENNGIKCNKRNMFVLQLPDQINNLIWRKK